MKRILLTALALALLTGTAITGITIGPTAAYACNGTDCYGNSSGNGNGK